MMEVWNRGHAHLKMWNRDTEIKTLDRRLSYGEEAASLSLERTVSRVMWRPGVVWSHIITSMVAATSHQYYKGEPLRRAKAEDCFSAKLAALLAKPGRPNS